jgi:16S rRNA processing protein RimM
VYLFAAGSEVARPFEVENAWPHRGGWVLKFQGIDSISEAERWRGAELRVPLAERETVPPGEYYLADLVGCRVVDRETGTDMGEVTGWHENADQVWLTVVRGGEELLVPFAASIIPRIDASAGIVEVVAPEGLWELNR